MSREGLAPRPPRLAERLLRHCLRHSAAARTILGDLREEFATIVRRRSRLRANAWYWREAFAVGVPYFLARLIKRARQPAQRAGRGAALRRDWDSAVRVVRTAPLFTFGVAGTLALGIAANTLVFSLVNGVLLRPLPYSNAERLVSVSESYGGGEMPVGWASVPNYLDWKDESTAFESLALFRGRSMSLTVDGVAQYVYGVWVTAEFFTTFGTAPFLGRTIRAEENVPGAAPVVILSHRTWQDRYGGDPDIVGRTVDVNGTGRTIVGVMPAGFNAPARWIGSGLAVDVWVPFELMPGSNAQARGNRSYNVVGRLRSGINLENAAVEFEVLSARMREAHPEANGEWSVHLVAWHELIVGRVRSLLVLLWGAVGGVLLIACANVINLHLNRLASRGGELAVRSALGAGRVQLIRQLLAESVATAALAAIIASLLAVVGLRLLRAVNPGDIPRLDEVRIDITALTATLAGAIVIGIVIGLVCALRVARDDAVSILRAGTARTGRSVTGRGRVHAAIAVVQLAVSIPLLIGAGLLGRSFLRLINEPPGLDAPGVLTATVVLSWDRMSVMADRLAFVRDVLERIEGVPGVERVGMINSLPLSGSNAQMPIRIEGRPEPRPGETPVAAFRGVSPGYFATLGIPILAGRDFGEQDLRVPTTALVNATMARRFWTSDAVIGQRFRLEGADEPLTIIGVVGDVKHYGLDAAVRPEVYQPYTTEYLSSKTFVVRSSTDVQTLAGPIRAAILEVDPDQPIRDITPLDAYVSRSMAGPRFNATMLALASAVAVTLTMIGLFSVVAYSVTERTHEMRIRMALGARRREVIALVLRRGAMLAGGGAVAGLLVAAATGRLLERFLFGVRPGDPVTYVVVSVTFFTVAMLASYLPARRASRVDPVQTLRS